MGGVDGCGLHLLMFVATQIGDEKLFVQVYDSIYSYMLYCPGY